MKLNYKLAIENPETHKVNVEMKLSIPKGCETLDIFMPRWSPGSYLMREYGRNISRFQATNALGEVYHHKQVDMGVYRIDFKKSEIKNRDGQCEISYQVFCHELSVRTSYINREHAFIHGPSVFMGILNQQFEVELDITFPAIWSKLSTALKDISPSREIFRYYSPNYDELIDSPIEIGCHETDGFQVKGVDHHLAFFGDQLPHRENFNKDIKKIVETVVKSMGEIPFENYLFITHFHPGIYGGLEHLNSTALQFSPLEYGNKNNYLKWLELVAHEYFHAWNVKRIRPKELGPFNYLKEAKTSMHWLTEGLTSFMDLAFVLRAGFADLEYYFDQIKVALNRYLQTPGRFFHSLENSSYNAWVKLYRPDANSLNSSVSYYLKGGLVFFCLNALFFEKGIHIDQLLRELWRRYKENPDKGMTSEEVYQIIEKLAGKEVRDEFEMMVTTTEDIDFEKYFSIIGAEFEWKESGKVYLGIQTEYIGEQVMIKSVTLDSPAHKSGLNAGDELIAINNLRMTATEISKHHEFLLPNHRYNFLVSRNKGLVEVDMLTGIEPRTLEKIKVLDPKKAMKSLSSLS